MSKIRHRSFLAAIGLSALALVLLQSLPAQAASGTAASSSVSLHAQAAATCGYSVVEFTYVNEAGGTHLGSVELLYDPCTRDVYTHGTTYETCHSDGSGCIYASVTDPGDGSSDASCTSGHNGQPQETCNTGKVNDAGVTHEALGCIGVWCSWTKPF